MSKRCLFCFTLLVMLLAACATTPTMTQQTASYTVTLSFDTLAVGDRAATVNIRDSAGPVDNAEVIVTPTMLSMGMASPETVARPTGNGRYTSDAILISMVGDWELDVTITRDGTSETARFLFTVATQ